MSETVVITGGSRGIGSETARFFASKGFNVLIGYNNSENKAIALLSELRENGYNAEICKVDVKSSDSANAFVDFALKTFGSIDLLINNAGIAEQKLITDITDSDWDNMISTNLTGVFYVTRAALPHFINKKNGSIINVSSMWGEVGASMECHYSAAKAGVIGLTKALAKELGPSNVKVNCIAPGVIDTDMNRSFSSDTLNTLVEEIPLAKIGKPIDVAKAIYSLYKCSDFVTGQILGVNGGMVI